MGLSLRVYFLLPSTVSGTVSPPHVIYFVQALWCVWRPEDSLQELLLCFWCVDSGIKPGSPSLAAGVVTC